MRALVLLALAVLGGCGELKKPPPPPPSAPFTLNKTTPDGEVSLTLARHIGDYPALHLSLFNSAQRELAGFLKEAAAGRAQAAKGGYAFQPYARSMAWSIAAESPRLLGLRQAWTEYSGGAHGAYGIVALTWDKVAGAPVVQSALFKPDADYAALDRLLCDGARAVKARRLGPEAAAANDWTCPTWKDSRALLAPSTLDQRIGGLTFMFDPYVLGPYAEGAYEVTIPQARFRLALAPAYAAQFGGDPVQPAPPPRD